MSMPPRSRGRIVCAGQVAGVDATINLDEFSRKRIRMIGTTFRPRSMHERIASVRAFCVDVLPALESATICPIIDHVDGVRMTSYRDCGERRYIPVGLTEYL